MTHTSTIFLVLRRLRTPLIVLITLFAISVLGLTLMPGPPDPNGGQLPRMSFFHAVYFISYTATTIGFGEIPYAFSEQQRLWTVVCIYMSVVGWAASTTFSLKTRTRPWMSPAIGRSTGNELRRRPIWVPY